MTEILGGFNTQGARDSLNQRNALWQAQATIASCQKMREKYHKVANGLSKREFQYFKDPARPSSYIKIMMHSVDGAVQTVFTMNDSKVWEYCAIKRKQDAQDKASGLKLPEFAVLGYKCTPLLEIYLLLKYAIDLRGQEWQDPHSDEGKKFRWVMDRDEFCMRYKTTNLMESRNAQDPFRKYH